MVSDDCLSELVMRDSGSSRHYIIPVLSKALDILELLEQSSSSTPEVLQRRSGVSQSTVYRILRTLVHRGYVVRTEPGSYRLVSRPRKLRFGLCSQTEETDFTSAVFHSLREASLNAGIDLVAVGNPCLATPESATSKWSFDLMILFRVDPDVGQGVTHRLATEGLAMIAIDMPLPRATYCGLDHYSVGFDMGAHLGRHAAMHWGKRGVRVLGLEPRTDAGVPHSVITGAFDGVRTVVPDLPARAFVRAGGGDCAGAVTELLRSKQTHEKLLIAASSDMEAMQALRVVRVLGRERAVAILGCGCTSEGLREMREASSPWIGSVSMEANLYGSIIIDLGLSILRGNRVQPYNFVPHRLITAAGLRARAAAGA